MSATYEGMSPGGHETYATSIFSKIKTYLDSNPYGYLTTHQDISGKADKSATVSTVTWSNNKLTKTINGTTSDVVSAATILGNLTSSQVTTALGFTPTANTGTITSVKTTAGTHTTINVSSGAANFNVPTKTSHLTNDSGFVTTDANVTQTATDGSSNAEYEILFSGTADNTTRTEGTRKTRLFTFNPQTNQVTAGHFTAKSSDPSGNKTASLVGYDVQLGGASNTWDGTHTSLTATISSLKQSLSDYIKIKSIVVLKNDAARNMDLSSYVSIDSGYKFLCWLVSGASNGWITPMPIYISLPNGVTGNPWWHPNLTISGAINFYYLEIKNV